MGILKGLLNVPKANLFVRFCLTNQVCLLTQNVSRYLVHNYLVEGYNFEGLNTCSPLTSVIGSKVKIKVAIRAFLPVCFSRNRTRKGAVGRKDRQFCNTKRFFSDIYIYVGFIINTPKPPLVFLFITPGKLLISQCFI